MRQLLVLSIIVCLCGSIISQANVYVDNRLGVGIDTPVHKVDVYDGSIGSAYMMISSNNSSAANGLIITTSRPDLTTAFPVGGGNRGWMLQAVENAHSNVGVRSDFRLLHFDGSTWNQAFSVETDGDLSVFGKVTVLGSDFAEKFDIKDNEFDKGMIVSIDPLAPGKLEISTKAYDRNVAGVISGAGDIQTGMLMGQEGTLADGDTPVALSGRVYAYVDASYGEIEIGDLITTSNTYGHGMKAKKMKKSFGAVVGKALEPLQEGKGLILLLVNPQ